MNTKMFISKFARMFHVASGGKRDEWNLPVRGFHFHVDCERVVSYEAHTTKKYHVWGICGHE